MKKQAAQGSILNGMLTVISRLCFVWCMSILMAMSPAFAAGNTERCIEQSNEYTAGSVSQSKLKKAVKNCVAAAAAHPNSNSLNTATAKLMVAANNPIGAIPYIETLLSDDLSEDVANLVHNTCINVADNELADLTISDVFSADGTRSLSSELQAYCSLSASLEAGSEEPLANAAFWASQVALLQLEVNNGVRLLNEATMRNHGSAMDLSAYLCDVIDLDDPTAVFEELPVLADDNTDLLEVASGACEAAMTNPPEGRKQGEFVERLAIHMLRYDMTEEASELLTNAALSLDPPFNERASSLIFQLCDAAAIHPDESLADGAGVVDSELIAAQAIDFCFAALQLEQDDPRLNFQYARGLVTYGELDQAAELFQYALDNGYQLAAQYLNTPEFNINDFAAREIVQALYDGNDTALADIEAQYQTVLQTALGSRSDVSPYVSKFLIGLVEAFKGKQTYPCNKSYLDGTELVNLQTRLSHEMLKLQGEMMRDPWAAIGKILTDTGIAGQISAASKTGNIAPVLQSLGRTQVEVQHMYEGATQMGAATAEKLAIDYECGIIAKNIIENINDYSSSRPMRHKN